VQRKDVADLRVFVSPAFQVQRADGAGQNKTELLRNLPDLRSYKLRSLRVTRDANVLVVTFQAATNEIINGQPLRIGYSPRLATFIRGAKDWRITAYANFNTPR
jgi:hypothetical protein